MARIAGVELPDEKRIDFSLTKIYGVGWAAATEILEKSGVDSYKRTRDLTEEEVSKLAKAISNRVTEGDLRREIRQNIQRLKDIGSYKGVRHSKNLPLRGQRTRTNARTKRGAKQTIGAFKKELLSKMGTQKSEGNKNA